MAFGSYSLQYGKKQLFIKTVRNYYMQYHVSSPCRPNYNTEEESIIEMKKRWYHIMHKKKVLERLWDYGLAWISDTGNISASISRHASDRKTLICITIETSDISEYFDFIYYYWVNYRENSGLEEILIGRWLGVSHKVG